MNIEDQLKEIKGNFIICGKPKIINNEIIGWITSLVKLDLIKTIHNDTTYCKDEIGCIFYTYKDEWYVCSVNWVTLCKTVNKYLGIDNVTSHGSEISRNNFIGTHSDKD